MLIDIHVHTCRMRPLAKALGRHFVEPATMIDMMDARGIDRAIFRRLRDERRISPEVCEKIAWKNADRLLGLGLQGC